MTIPGSLFFAGGLGVAILASLCAAPPTYAQRWLSWDGVSPSQPGADPAKRVPAGTPRTKPKAPPERVAPAIAQHEQSGTATVQPSRAAVAPALAEIEPWPSPSPVPLLMEVAVMASMPIETATVSDAPVALMQITSCDEPGHCEHPDAVHSGVGGRSKGLKDEATKRRPERDARRHVLQSVRSIW